MHGGENLPQIGAGHVDALDAHRGRFPVAGVVEGAEDEIPEDEVVPEVLVGLLDVAGVVPAVELGHAEDIVEWT